MMIYRKNFYSIYKTKISQRSLRSPYGIKRSFKRLNYKSSLKPFIISSKFKNDQKFYRYYSKNDHLNNNNTSKTEKNKKIAFYVLGSIIICLGLSYAFVPLYRIFCSVTGFAGTVKEAQTGVKKVKVDTSREITVHFTSNVSDDLNWDFYPKQTSVNVFPGDATMAFYEVTNHSDVPVIGIATYNIVPHQLGSYFYKIECFCFDEQVIGPGMTVELPLLFRIEPEILKDKNSKNAYQLTLSYTFFKSPDQDL